MVQRKLSESYAKYAIFWLETPQDLNANSCYSLVDISRLLSENNPAST